MLSYAIIREICFNSIAGISNQVYDVPLLAKTLIIIRDSVFRRLVAL